MKTNWHTSQTSELRSGRVCVRMCRATMPAYTWLCVPIYTKIYTIQNEIEIFLLILRSLCVFFLFFAHTLCTSFVRPFVIHRLASGKCVHCLHTTKSCSCVCANDKSRSIPARERVCVCGSDYFNVFTKSFIIVKFYSNEMQKKGVVARNNNSSSMAATIWRWHNARNCLNNRIQNT